MNDTTEPECRAVLEYENFGDECRLVCSLPAGHEDRHKTRNGRATWTAAAVVPPAAGDPR
jgi:hypothetical protein